MTNRPDEPTDGDYVVSDDGPLGSLTRVSVVDGTRSDRERWQHPFRSEDDAHAAIRSAMERDHFYPNVWRLDDHGGLTLLEG